MARNRSAIWGKARREGESTSGFFCFRNLNLIPSPRLFRLKGLMLLTAINFMPAALFRVSPLPYEYTLFWSFGIPAFAAALCFAWHTAKYRKINYVFAAGVALLVVMVQLRFVVPDSSLWFKLVATIAP